MLAVTCLFAVGCSSSSVPADLAGSGPDGASVALDGAIDTDLGSTTPDDAGPPDEDAGASPSVDGGPQGGAPDLATPYAPYAASAGSGLALGLAQSCAITATGRVKCWGSGTEGGLGVPRFSGCLPSCGPIVATELPGIENATGIAVTSFNRTLYYRTSAGALYQYANGSTFMANDVTGLSWTVDPQVAWIATGTGRLRAGGGSATTTADPSTLLPGAMRFGGGQRTCASFPTALTKNVVCWDQDGIASEQTGTAGATSVDATSASACAVLSTGRVRCWGGAYGAAPGVDVGVDGATQVATSTTQELQACAVLSSGSLVCWAPSATPIVAPIAGLSGVTEVGVGPKHACARTGAGAIYCWGSNVYGELGNGMTATQVDTPVLVQGL